MESPLARARARANRYREDRRRAAATNRAEKELQREKLRKQKAKLEEAELQFRQEQDEIARQCQICSLLQAQAWGMEYQDWAERRCGACFAAEAEHKARVLHMMCDEEHLPAAAISPIMPMHEAQDTKPDAGRFDDMYADEQFWTVALPELERRLQEDFLTDARDANHGHQQTSPVERGSKTIAANCSVTSDFAASMSQSVTRLAKSGGNPWSVRHSVYSTDPDHDTDVDSIPEILDREGSSTGSDQQSEATIDKISGQSSESAAVATAGSANDSQRDQLIDTEKEEEEDFKELLVRYRPVPAVGMPQVPADFPGRNSRGENIGDTAPEDSAKNAKQDEGENMGVGEGDEVGEPMSTEEMIEMLKLAEDWVVLGQTPIERKKALLVAADLRKAISYGRLRHQRLPVRTALWDDRDQEIRMLNGCQQGYRLGSNRARTMIAPQADRAAVLMARKRERDKRKASQSTPWIPSSGKAGIPLAAKHPEGFGVAGEANAMVPGIHWPIHQDTTPLCHDGGQQVSVHLLHMQKSSRGLAATQRRHLEQAQAHARPPVWRSPGGGQW